MDDRFLHELRREPRPEFARALHQRLRTSEAPAAPRFRLLKPAFAAAAAVAAVTALFAFPAVRVSAQAFLDLFRVRNFTAVPFDASRMEQLRTLEQDNALLVFDKQDVVKAPGPAQQVASADAAGAIAGIDVQEPAYLPSGMRLDRVEVQGEGEARLVVRAERLRTLLDALDLRDVQVPPMVDGQTLTLRMHPVVTQHFKSERRDAHLVQALSPEVALPAGLDLARLGEIGLRILGLDEREAHRVASSVDWSSTLLVPVPVNATSFRDVTVRGSRGLLVTTTDRPSPGGRPHREGAVVMWTEGDRVFALAGNVDSLELVQMAESLR